MFLEYAKMNKPSHIKRIMTLTLTGMNATQLQSLLADVQRYSAIENGELLLPFATMNFFRRKHCARYPGICAS